MHYFTIGQREALEKALLARAETLREEIREDAQADLNAEPEAVALKLDVAELRAVEAALSRLHTPDFGVCGDCAAQIPYSRLSANPAALRCVDCQAKQERA